MVWYGMVWYGMVRYGMVWYGKVWYGIVFQVHVVSIVWCASVYVNGCWGGVLNIQHPFICSLFPLYVIARFVLFLSLSLSLFVFVFPFLCLWCFSFCLCLFPFKLVGFACLSSTHPSIVFHLPIHQSCFVLDRTCSCVCVCVCVLCLYTFSVLWIDKRLAGCQVRSSYSLYCLLSCERVCVACVLFSLFGFVSLLSRSISLCSYFHSFIHLFLFLFLFLFVIFVIAILIVL